MHATPKYDVTEGSDVGRTLDLLFGKAPTIAHREEDTPAPATGIESMIPSRAEIGRHVSRDEALSLPMVFRAVQILAFASKQLSIDTFRNGVRIDDHDLVRRPDPFLARSKWIERTVTSLATTGNAYWELVNHPDGSVAQVKILNPLHVRIRTNGFGQVTGYAVAGRERPLPPSKVKHLTLLSVEGNAYGLGPIQSANPDLRGALDTRDYAANWFDSGGQPNGILKSDQTLNSDRAAEAKKQWNESAGARNGVAVLGQGLSYQPVYIAPKDAQFIESRQFDVTSIARMFGTPASLMLAAVEGSSQTYANVEQDWIAFTRFTLMGYLVEIEDALSELLPGRQRAGFNVEALHRADITTRYAAHKTAIEIGLYSAEYARGIENIPSAAAGVAASDKEIANV